MKLNTLHIPIIPLGYYSIIILIFRNVTLNNTPSSLKYNQKNTCIWSKFRTIDMHFIAYI